MSELELVQNTEEWLSARAGSLGASQVHEALARTKTSWCASRANVMATLIIERLTGKPTETYTNAAMQHGRDTEPQARAAYEFERTCEVVEVGLVKHPTIVGTHASPDGYVGDDGLIEIKCPASATHLDTLLGQSIPSKYVSQMFWQMACTGRKWCDYVSFDPRMPAHMQLFIKRIERDDKAIAEMEQMVSDFLAELDAKIAMLDKIYGQREAA